MPHDAGSLVLNMNNPSLERWTWVLIYGGLLVIGLGLFMLRAGQAPGWPLLLGGGALVAVGAVLVVVRSRRPDISNSPARPASPDEH